MESATGSSAPQPRADDAATRRSSMRFVPLVLPLMAVLLAACAAVILSEV
ncbi:MAG: hypothetical protein M9907_14060 [Burkholderiaceae bacterium]|nr:hypothetical protein [Burkholderiaceae bacterium]